jgi:hypothetical protein
MGLRHHTASLIAVGLIGLGGTTPPSDGGSPTDAAPVGMGGAGAFMAPAHADGVFGAGGPDAASGGAGAFMAPAHADGVFGAGGPDAAKGGAGAFIPSAAPPAAGD